MTNKTKAAIEEAADKYEHKYDGISAMDYTAGMQEVIEHPEKYSLTSEYWRERCESAENYIDCSPYDPDITSEQLSAYNN